MSNDLTAIALNDPTAIASNYPTAIASNDPTAIASNEPAAKASNDLTAIALSRRALSDFFYSFIVYERSIDRSVYFQSFLIN